MNKTIAGVNSQPRIHNGQYGLTHYVSGCFDDGTEWSVGCKPHESEGRIKELEKLIGQPGEFEFKGEPKEFRGITQYTLAAWPGKPAYNGFGGGFKGGAGGGAKWTESYAQSKEAHAITQRSIQRACALERAVQTFGGVSCQDSADLVLRIADDFFAWLSDQGTQRPPPAPSEPARQMEPAKPTPKGAPTPQDVSRAVTEPVAESHEFVMFRQWLVGHSEDVSTAWKAVYTIANQMQHSQQSLRQCGNPQVFKTIREKMEGGNQQPNRQRQPVAAGNTAYDSDEPPF